MRDRAENQITCVWIRHGETDANREHRYLGRTDEPLSGAGREMLRAYKQRGCYPDVQYLFSSPMKRCLQTAEILYPGRKPVVIPQWREIDFGRFEYKNYRELQNDAQYQAWLDSGGVLPFPDGESREAFITRCEQGFHSMCAWLRRKLQAEQEADGQKDLAAKAAVLAGSIVHGGVIMALLNRHGAKQYFDYQAPNGGGYVCTMCGWARQARMINIQALNRQV